MLVGLLMNNTRTSPRIIRISPQQLERHLLRELLKKQKPLVEHSISTSKKEIDSPLSSTALARVANNGDDAAGVKELSTFVRTSEPKVQLLSPQTKLDRQLKFQVSVRWVGRDSDSCWVSSSLLRTRLNEPVHPAHR